MENKFNYLYKNINNANIIATVVSNRNETTNKASYIVKVDSINGDKKFKGTKLIIYLSKGKKLEYGDKLSLIGKYEIANASSNYKAFNYREYLKSQNIYGIFNVEQSQLIKKEDLSLFLLAINNIREKIKLNLKQILGKEANVTIRNFASETHQI